jgi:hypothetical protein
LKTHQVLIVQVSSEDNKVVTKKIVSTDHNWFNENKTLKI